MLVAGVLCASRSGAAVILALRVGPAAQLPGLSQFQKLIPPSPLPLSFDQTSIR